MSKLGPTVPARSGVQKEGKAEQGAAQPNALLGSLSQPRWECACREAGKAAKGQAPAREEAESQWKQVATQRHQGKGVEGSS